MKTKIYQCLLILAFSFVPIISFADTEDNFDLEKHLYLSYGKEELLEGKVLEISFAETHSANNIEDRFSFTILSTEKFNYGLEFGRRYFVGNDLRLFVGGGLFLGEYFQCSTEDTVTLCEEGDTFAVYPEIGYMVTFKKHRIVFFDRHYYQLEPGLPDYNLLGISLGYQF